MAFGASTPTPDIGTVERVIVHDRVVACDGNIGNLGHPRVWLRIVEQETYCPYCSRTFVLADDAPDDNH